MIKVSETLIKSLNSQLYIQNYFFFFFDVQVKMSGLKAALEDWQSTCTVPSHPKRCPECQNKVKLYHTPNNEAAFMCSNIGKVRPSSTTITAKIIKSIHNNSNNDCNK